MTDATMEMPVQETAKAASPKAVKSEKTSIGNQHSGSTMLVVIGLLITGVGAFAMPTTIETTTTLPYSGIEIPDRVANMDAIAQKVCVLIGGLGLMIMGSIGMAAAAIRKTMFKLAGHEL